LSPKGDPFRALGALKGSDPWFFQPLFIPSDILPPGWTYPSGERAIAQQIVSLAGAAAAKRANVDQWPDEEFDKRWAAARDAFLALHPRWDAKRGIYTPSEQRPNASSLRESRRSR
jgi:hypothetical protein